MKLISWRQDNRRLDRPIKWHYWPVSIGWVRGSCPALITWQSWPIGGSAIYPDAIAKEHGWTIHVGALKIYFGRLKSK